MTTNWRQPLPRWPTALGALHVAVNCAGIATAGKTLGKGNEPLNLGPFRKTVEVNLIGTFNVIRFACRANGAKLAE